MNKKRLLQIGAVSIVLIIIGIGILFSIRKGWFGIGAETLPGTPQNLEAFLPSVANDIPQNYWAYKYIDAVLKYKVPATGEYMIPLLGTMSEEEDNTYFGPAKTIDDFALGVFASRIANIAPKTTCAGNYYSDLPASHWACEYIEAAADNNVYWGTYKPSKASPLNTFDEDTSKPATVGRLKGILWHLGISQNMPPGMPAVSDNDDLTRERFAAYTAFNMSLPGDDPRRSVLLRFLYPRNDEIGFDLGYEIYRQAPAESNPTYIFGVDPPENGLTEAADFGLAYDHPEKSGTYIYSVYFFNRDGEYTNPASITVNVP